MRGFPFALAHEGAALARRAAPVDARRRFAREKRAELPECLARPRLATSVHAMHQAMGDLPRRDDEARQTRRQRRRLMANATAGRGALCRHQRKVLSTRRAMTPGMVSPSARAA